MKTFKLFAYDIIDLQLKLEGKLPVDRDELLALVNSWGRNDWFYTKDKNNHEIKIEECEENEKYELSKLDVSEITNFSSIFEHSSFDGYINLWNVSNATSMSFMFSNAESFNTPLDNWNVSNVTIMYKMFHSTTNFNQLLNSWNISKVTNMDFIFANAETFNQPLFWDLSKIESCEEMFNYAEAFEKRFNNGKDFPFETNKIKKLLIKNRNKMIALDTKESKGNELDAFLLNLNNNGIYNGKI